MSMTVEGAGLIAQVYPVGLLTLAVEGRILLGRPYRYPPTRLKLKQRHPYFRESLSWRNLFHTVWAVSIPFSIIAVAVCIWSVCSDVPLSDGWTFSVGTAGALLGVGVGWTLGRVIEPQRPDDEAEKHS